MMDRAGIIFSRHPQSHALLALIDRRQAGKSRSFEGPTVAYTLERMHVFTFLCFRGRGFFQRMNFGVQIQAMS